MHADGAAWMVLRATAAAIGRRIGSSPASGSGAGIFAAQAELNVTLLLFNLLKPARCSTAPPFSPARRLRAAVMRRVAKVAAVACLRVLLCVGVLLALLSGRFDPTLTILATLCCAWRTRRLHKAVGNGVASVQKHPLFKTLPPDPTRDDSSSSGARSRVASLFGRGGGDSSSGSGLRVATAPQRPDEPTEAQRMFGTGRPAEQTEAQAMFGVTVHGTAPLEAPRPNAIWPPPSFQPD